MKKLLTLLAFALMASATFAQTADVEEEVIYEKNKHKVVTNTFWHNWFIQVGGGAQVFYSDHTKQMDFGDRLAPAIDFGVGKWFSPQIGVRVMLSGYRINGATQTWGGEGVHSTGKPIDGKYTHDYGFLEHQQFDYLNTHAEVLFNMSNILCGYKEKRVWNCSPYLGVGWMFTWESPRSRQISFNAGIFNAIRLSDKFDFNIDLRTTLVKDDFDGEVGGRKEEGLWVATFGFSYKFKQRGWDRSKTVIRNNRAEANALQKQLEAVQQQNAALEKDLKNAKAQPKEVKVIEKESVVAPVMVIFPIGKSTLSNEARVTLGLLAKTIKAADTKTVYTIAGYADEGTGSKRFNEKLSEARAQAVYNCLTEEYGVDESQLRIVSKGGVANMFYNDPRLSRAVITGENAEGSYDLK